MQWSQLSSFSSSFQRLANQNKFVEVISMMGMSLGFVGGGFGLYAAFIAKERSWVKNCMFAAFAMMIVSTMLILIGWAVYLSAILPGITSMEGSILGQALGEFIGTGIFKNLRNFGSCQPVWEWGLTGTLAQAILLVLIVMLLLLCFELDPDRGDKGHSRSVELMAARHGPRGMPLQSVQVPVQVAMVQRNYPAGLMVNSPRPPTTSLTPAW